MYLDPNDHNTGFLVQTLIDSAQTEQDSTLVSKLGAKLTVEPNNSFCYSIGDNKEIAGYGETAYKAMLDFNNNFYNQKA